MFSRVFTGKFAPDWQRGLLLACLFTSIVVSCGEADDKSRISHLIDQAVAAAESRSPAFFREHIADTFQGSPVASKQELISLLRLYWLRNQKIRVYVTDRNIQVEGDVAQVDLIVLLTANTDAGGVMPDQGQYLNISAQMRKQDGWIVLSAQWH